MAPKAKKGKGGLLRRLALLTLALGIFACAAGAAAALYAFQRYGHDLPDHRMLAGYEPPVATRIYAADGSPLAEFATQKRAFVPIEAIPLLLRQAFLAAEDRSFYSHFGIDPVGILRASVANVRAIGQGRRLQGASTITQQVAKNFLLTGEVSWERKIREAILALRIEGALDKDRIFELYLNEIYLGFGSYGVAAAALNYFDKALDELTLAEAAYLAALPKAPNNYHPTKRHRAAIERRNWVIARMAEEGFVGEDEAAAARAEGLVPAGSSSRQWASAAYAVEEIRREIVDRYGGRALYEGGLHVRATVDPRLQDAARRALREGLSRYDRRHGWRGPLAAVTLGDDWAQVLGGLDLPGDLAPWRPAVVLGMNEAAAVIGFADGSTGLILLEDMAWARLRLEDGGLGPAVARPADVLATGDVVPVAALDQERRRRLKEGAAAWALRQLPDVSGAIVAMDPHSGRVLAMEGGFSFESSEFNRAVQAHRQPGSAFKPFVYMAALDRGFTPASIVEDAPFVFDPGAGQPLWRPANYSEEFFGPTPLRIGVEESRNLMTVRLASAVGPETVATYASAFDVWTPGDPFYLPMALGAGETTLLAMTTAYAMIVNGGRRVVPSLVERIQDRHGRTVWRRDERPCEACNGVAWHPGLAVPRLPDLSERVVDERTAYQMVHIMEGVVERGTARSLRELARPLAGKTGTTNDNRDAWFVGFAPDLAIGVYVGFDLPRSLGRHETGAAVALPVWKAFAAEALADAPVVPFRIPPGIRLVRIDADRGLLPGAATERVIVEAFRAGSEPVQRADRPAEAPEDAYRELSISDVY